MKQTIAITNEGMYLRVQYRETTDPTRPQEYRIRAIHRYNVGSEHAYRMQRDILHWLDGGMLPSGSGS